LQNIIMVDMVANTPDLRLPEELLLLVFQHLDPPTLLAVRQTCRAWDQLIQSSVLLWKSRVRLHFGSHPNQCALQKLPLYKERKKSATRLQALERRLRRLDMNLRENRFEVKTIDCLEAELHGKKVVKSDEWEATHNYRGVYDMILDSNRLIASVYDTIQVWDLSTYQMTNLLNPKSLDSPNAATTCFAVLRDKLVCGTQNGLLKLIDLESGKEVSTTRRNNNYVSDVCVKGDTVVAVDWYGGLSKWLYTGHGFNSRLIEQEGDWEVGCIFYIPHPQ
jgi:WD40 repeat protein